MKKSIAAIVLWLPLAVCAQMFNFSFKTSNQQFIEEAIKSSIVGIEQKYALSDPVTGDEFGRNGLDYFNYVDYIGIETDKGLFTYAEVLAPWIADKDFSQYEGKYEPVLTATEIYRFDKGRDGAKLHEDFASMIESINGLVFSRDTSSTVQGMQFDIDPGAKDGWAIWITRKDNSEKIDSVAFTCIKQKIEIPGDGSPISAAVPDVDNEILGGLYVTPQVTGPGQLTFFINGMYACIDGEWFLAFPFITPPAEAEPAEAPIESDNEKLTPIEAPNQLQRIPKFEKK